MALLNTILLLCSSATIFGGSESTTSLKVSENNGNGVFVELLRGRDGLPGRDGPPGTDGKQGPAGPRGPPGPHGPQSGGAMYVRWGKSTCSQTAGTKMVYSGIAAGNFFNVQGGGANHLCMPKVPEYSPDLTYRSTSDGHARIYGMEYQFPLQGTHDLGVPCAVCHVTTRPSLLVIPAKASCPPTWTKEYYGYLMTEHHLHRRSMYECVDADQEVLPNSHGNQDGSLFYHVEHWPPLPSLQSKPGTQLCCVHQMRKHS